MSREKKIRITGIKLWGWVSKWKQNSIQMKENGFERVSTRNTKELLSALKVSSVIPQGGQGLRGRSSILRF
jgi:hypothetical protein